MTSKYKCKIAVNKEISLSSLKEKLKLLEDNQILTIFSNEHELPDLNREYVFISLTGCGYTASDHSKKVIKLTNIQRRSFIQQANLILEGNNKNKIISIATNEYIETLPFRYN